ncbi:MAG TPA: helix-hairpin-helix domain-containing protein [Candidatus Limnocylindria bacterium]|nr:helix-hairpin-helix domain-containing protein [Candidatus Limnocylindria bacterium]
MMLLPRVNEGMAQRIVAGRPYARVEDLLKVSGIGPKTLDGMRARVVVTTAPAK